MKNTKELQDVQAKSGTIPQDRENYVDARAIRCDEVRAGHDRGWSFTPLSGKKPTLNGWQARDRETLAEALQWAERGNVGVRTGDKSRVVVVDADPGSDPNDLRDLPKTWTAETGRDGGRHYYCTLPDGATIHNSASKLGDHIDVRGNGGQVVAVGSIHPETGKTYRWAPGLSPDEVPLADLPASIVETLTSPTRTARQASGRGDRYAGAALADESNSVRLATEGKRNNTLNTAAFNLGQLVAAGRLTQAAVEAELLDAAGCCGLPDDEARATIASGLGRGMQKPRQVEQPRQARSDEPEKVRKARETLARYDSAGADSRQAELDAIAEALSLDGLPLAFADVLKIGDDDVQVHLADGLVVALGDPGELQHHKSVNAAFLRAASVGVRRLKTDEWNGWMSRLLKTARPVAGFDERHQTSQWLASFMHSSTIYNVDGNRPAALDHHPRKVGQLRDDRLHRPPQSRVRPEVAAAVPDQSAIAAEHRQPCPQPEIDRQQRAHHYIIPARACPRVQPNVDCRFVFGAEGQCRFRSASMEGPR